MFVIIWDNEHSSGRLFQSYDTEAAAIDAGEDWLAEMIAIDENPDEAKQIYSFDVIEIRGE